MLNNILPAKWQDNQLVDSGLTREEMSKIAQIFVDVWPEGVTSTSAKSLTEAPASLSPTSEGNPNIHLLGKKTIIIPK